MPNRIIHFGVGSFFRGHQAYYIDRYNRLVEPNERWYYTGVNLRADSRGLIEALAKQNGRYHLKKISAYGDIEIRKIEALESVIDASDNVGAIDDLFADQDAKVLTIPVTDGG